VYLQDPVVLLYVLQQGLFWSLGLKVFQDPLLVFGLADCVQVQLMLTLYLLRQAHFK